MIPLNALFVVQYGSKLDLNKMTIVSANESGINFVGRSSRNHGVSARIAKIEGREPYPAGCITVALGGTKLLASFVQLEPFYTAQNVAVLEPKEDFSFSEKLFICLCIRHNRFRYSAFGREANRTLRTLPVPARTEFPDWVYEADISAVFADNHKVEVKDNLPLFTERWKQFILSDLFDIKKGKRLTKAEMRPGSTAFISALDSNNGLRQRIDKDPDHDAGLITVNYNGNGVAEAFYQPEPFILSDDVNVLYPRFDMTPEIALFLCTIIRREKYRYSYGRKWTLDRMREAVVKLPATPAGLPDWNFMRSLIEAILPSSNVIGFDAPV